MFRLLSLRPMVVKIHTHKAPGGCWTMGQILLSFPTPQPWLGFTAAPKMRAGPHLLADSGTAPLPLFRGRWSKSNSPAEQAMILFCSNRYHSKSVGKHSTAFPTPLSHARGFNTPWPRCSCSCPCSEYPPLHYLETQRSPL